MLTRNDQPFQADFNFANDSVFNTVQKIPASSSPVLPNRFLLLDGTDFLLLDGTNLLLLGT